jgi:hypothetical protein
MKQFKSMGLNQNLIIKLYKEKSCYNGFIYIGSKEIIGTNEKINPTLINAYYLVIYKHILTGQIFGTPIRVSTGPGGIGYSTLIEKTTQLTDLENYKNE